MTEVTGTNDFSQNASSILREAVLRAKEEYDIANRKFSKANREIQKKASSQMNLFANDTLSRVGDVVSEARRVCDELYASLQTILVNLDMACRPYLDQNPEPSAVYDVVKMIKKLNEDSNIENDYSASLNSHSVGTVTSVRYRPSIANVAIEKFWEQHFRTMNGHDAILEQERKQKEENRQARLKAQQLISNTKREDHNVIILHDMQRFEASVENKAEIDHLSKIEKEIKSEIKKEKKRLNELVNTQTETRSATDAEIEKLQSEISKVLCSKKKKERNAARISELYAKADCETKIFRKQQVEAEAYIAFLNDKIEEIKRRKIMLDPKKGDCVFFGTSLVEKKAIEWIIVGCSEDSVALLSKESIGYAQFKKELFARGAQVDDYVTWLVNFGKCAFSAEEKKLLLPTPNPHCDSAKHTFVYTQRDFTDFLPEFLASKPSKEAIAHINSQKGISDYEKQRYVTALNTSYWLHSREPMSELRVNYVKKQDDGKWMVKTLDKVTNDSFTAGMRPGILIKRSQQGGAASLQWDHNAYAKEMKKYTDPLSAKYAKADEDERHSRKLLANHSAKRSKRKKGLFLTALTVLLILAIVLLSTFWLIPSVHYSRAEGQLAQGNTIEAAMLFGKAGMYSDAKERSFALWENVADRDVLSVGGSIYMSGGGFFGGINKDGSPLVFDVERRIEIEDGEYIAVAATSGSIYYLRPDGTVAGHALSPNFGVSKWRNIVNIKGGPNPALFGVKSDGTVVSSNEDYHKRVQKWTDIVDIAVGKNHVVGLKADGTVIAAALEDKVNKEGELNVENWRDIVKIEAGIDITLGLKADGTVVATGNDRSGAISGTSEWSDIVDFTAFGDPVAGLKSDGTVVVAGSSGFYNHGENYAAEWTDIVMIECGCFYVLGVKPDGTLLVAGELIRDPEPWPELDIPTR